MSSQEIALIMTELKSMREEFTEHRKRACEHWKANMVFQEEMRPIIEAQRWIVLTHKFLKWGGLSVAALIAGTYWFFRRII